MVKLREGYDKGLSEAIGNNIRIQRTVKGMSRAYVAQQLGVSVQQLQKYETGQNRISAEFIFHLSSLLEIDLQTLFPHPEVKATADDSSDQAISGSKNSKLLNAYRRINDPKIRGEILSLVKSLSDK
jgi:transcriptional regulator with XRE-family HTH domain